MIIYILLVSIVSGKGVRSIEEYTKKNQNDFLLSETFPLIFDDNESNILEMMSKHWTFIKDTLLNQRILA